MALSHLPSGQKMSVRPLGAADYVDVQAFMWVTRELE